MEWILSGYCRNQDQTRTVLLERVDGLWDCDCSFPSCIFRNTCVLAGQIRNIMQEDAL